MSLTQVRTALQSSASTAPKINALSTDLVTELREAAESLIAHPPRAVVVWGGTRLFGADAEVSELGGGSDARRMRDSFETDSTPSRPSATRHRGHHGLCAWRRTRTGPRVCLAHRR